MTEIKQSFYKQDDIDIFIITFALHDITFLLTESSPHLSTPGHPPPPPPPPHCSFFYLLHGH